MQVFYCWVSMHDEKGGAVLSSDEANQKKDAMW
jgi:hypothetical protein